MDNNNSYIFAFATFGHPNDFRQTPLKNNNPELAKQVKVFDLSNAIKVFPNRDVKTKTIMNDLSKGFSHYKEGAGIKKDISLSNLRKTYLTWHHQVLGDDTGLVSSHSTTQVLEKYYLDPKVLTAVEISALKVRVFGKK